MKLRFGLMRFVERTAVCAAIPALLVLVLLAGCAVPKITNPYATVDWENHEQYKANFHTHTTHSDGHLHPHTVVDEYHKLGYTVLAITDHDEVTYPWTSFSRMELSEVSKLRVQREPHTMPPTYHYEDRDPAALGMVAIQGNELSKHHHMNSFFSSVNNTTTEEESLVATSSRAGLAMLNHPGRYKQTVEWYVDLYRRYDHLIGLEVYNTGDRYNKDRELWDAILTETMPERPVWGFSNDDMHTISTLGCNWNVLILPELSLTSVRSGMEQGLSYFVYAPRCHNGPTPPEINSIKVDHKAATIEIDASGYDSIEWISGGRKVHEGSTVNVKKVQKSAPYVRAVLNGPGGVTCTQPFGIGK